MRMYKYAMILHTEDGTNRNFVWEVYGANKIDAINKIDLMFPFSIKSVHRVNITDRKREKRESPSLAYVDMGQANM